MMESVVERKWNIVAWIKLTRMVKAQKTTSSVAEDGAS